jgi:hypothetical protein
MLAFWFPKCPVYSTMLHAARCTLHAARCTLHGGRFMLYSAWSMPSTACCRGFVACCVGVVACCVLRVACCMPRVAGRPDAPHATRPRRTARCALHPASPGAGAYVRTDRNGRRELQHSAALLQHGATWCNTVVQPVATKRSRRCSRGGPQSGRIPYGSLSGTSTARCLWVVLMVHRCSGTRRVR